MITAFEFIFKTPQNLPPPFSYTYCLIGKLDHAFSLDYELFYTGREQLTDEEIIDEGFTKNDNLSCQGNMPKIWKNEILRLLKNAQPTSETISQADNQMHIKIMDNKNNVRAFSPEQPELWEQTMQEMAQGLLESQKLEMPLTLSFKKKNQSKFMKIVAQIQFAERKVNIITHDASKNKNSIFKNWSVAQELMQLTFNNEFDVEKAHTKEPKNDGFFINLGNELWFQSRQSALNISEKKDTLKILEEFVLRL